GFVSRPGIPAAWVGEPVSRQEARGNCPLERSILLDLGAQPLGQAAQPRQFRLRLPQPFQLLGLRPLLLLVLHRGTPCAKEPILLAQALEAAVLQEKSSRANNQTNTGQGDT